MAVVRESVSRGEAGTVDVIVVPAWGTDLAEPITVVQKVEAPESARRFRLLCEPRIVQGRQMQEPEAVRPLLDEVHAGIHQHPKARTVGVLGVAFRAPPQSVRSISLPSSRAQSIHHQQDDRGRGRESCHPPEHPVAARHELPHHAGDEESDPDPEENR